MKFNLKNRPKVHKKEWVNESMPYEKWLEGFEAELREKILPELLELGDPKQLLIKEVLGE